MLTNKEIEHFADQLPTGTKVVTTGYLETFYESVTAVESATERLGQNIIENGYTGRYALAERWADEFELKYKNEEWINVDWIFTLWSFLGNKIEELEKEHKKREK